jgi:hypothetical protein
MTTKDPIDQYVYLIPQRNGPDIHWVWLYNGSYGSADNFPVINANNGHNTISFTVYDPVGALKFAGFNANPVDPGQAIWLWPKDSPNPKQPGNGSGGEFTPTILQQGLQLKLDDTNGKTKDYGYQLNFVTSGNPGTIASKIDPEIRNGDGNTNKYFAAAEYLVAGAVVGAILSVLFVRLALRWRAV